jgi:endoribonuclease Dicer
LKWVYFVLQHELSVTSSDLTADSVKSINKKMSKIFESSISCLEQLGAWLALKVLSLVLQ